ncbi:hypothetical protein FOL47_005630 [Perkinsus chesapeaki]|uniref:Uncharacterized protein n=1 Tax=Perkinsus chesapeaki TaxID=330153 RepID=A0A7J6MYG9_PERCH|nr:hypothetical protein FOL47_005630 [Perkinsus chesapeaki]
MMSSVPAWKKPNGRYLSIGGASTAASSSARPSVDIDPAIVAALQSAPPTQNLAEGHPPVYHGQQSEAPREPAENSPMVPPTVASMASRHDLSPRNNDASETSSRIVETLVGLMEDFKPLEEMSRDELYSFAAAVLLQDPPQRHGNSVRDDQYT